MYSSRPVFLVHIPRYTLSLPSPSLSQQTAGIIVQSHAPRLRTEIQRFPGIRTRFDQVESDCQEQITTPPVGRLKYRVVGAEGRFGDIGADFDCLHTGDSHTWNRTQTAVRETCHHTDSCQGKVLPYRQLSGKGVTIQTAVRERCHHTDSCQGKVSPYRQLSGKGVTIQTAVRERCHHTDSCQGKVSP